MTELTLLKTILRLLATPGIMAAAAVATNPAIKAYSMRSWPRVHLQIWARATSSKSRVMFMPYSNIQRDQPKEVEALLPSRFFLGRTSY